MVATAGNYSTIKEIEDIPYRDLPSHSLSTLYVPFTLQSRHHRRPAHTTAVKILHGAPILSAAVLVVIGAMEWGSNMSGQFGFWSAHFRMFCHSPLVKF